MNLVTKGFNTVYSDKGANDPPDRGSRAPGNASLFGEAASAAPPARYRPAGVDSMCPHEISGPLTNRVFYLIGVDAVQALQLVMKLIGAELSVCANAKTGRLTWLGEPKLGFPVYAPGTVGSYTDP